MLRAMSIRKGQAHPLVREDVTKDYDHKSSVAKKKKFLGTSRDLALRWTDWR
jgi:hypothetical protein